MAPKAKAQAVKFETPRRSANALQSEVFNHVTMDKMLVSLHAFHVEQIQRAQHSIL